jgi:diketogulonate reductase-like aldo/keto reductase
MRITDIKGRWQLATGVEMPYLGLGVWQTENGEQVVHAVKWAIESGYRHIDTAAIYQNEIGVGRGINESGVDRSDIFITSKVWNSDQGYDSTLKAFDSSLKKLGTDYLDLYLIHWPVAGKYRDTWKALEYLYKEKRVKAIGVSNFLKHHLEDLLSDVDIVPMVNQLEFHPYLLQQQLQDFCKSHQIQYEAWSPLMQGKAFDIEELQRIAQAYDKSVAQLLIRWNLQKGVITIPKSSNRDRIAQNADVFDFMISDEDMKRIDALDRNERVGPDPDNFDF